LGVQFRAWVDSGIRQVHDILHQAGIGRRGNRALPSAKVHSVFRLSVSPMVKLPPHEALLIQRVYDGISQESWFNRNAITERELLKLILQNYADRPADEAALLLACRDAARDRFSKPR
jgi:hypothetical protein